GAKRVRVLGEEVEVRASVHTIGGFSAHADRDDLEAFLARSDGAELLLVHGEPEKMDAFAAAQRAAGRRVRCPELGVPLELCGVIGPFVSQLTGESRSQPPYGAPVRAGVLLGAWIGSYPSSRCARRSCCRARSRTSTSGDPSRSARW